MAELLSIKERIERAYVAIIQGISGIGTVYRWDARGLRDPVTGLDKDAQGNRLSMKNGDAMIIADDEAASEGGDGSTGMTEKTLPMEIHFKGQLPEDDMTNVSQVHNRWLLKIETALMANPTILEPISNVRLAIDTRITNTGQPPREIGQREWITAVKAETVYEHYRTDPSTGPGIAQVTA